MSTPVLMLWVWTLLAGRLGTQACAIAELDLGQCSSISAPDNGNIDCNLDGNSIKCLASCGNGYRFEDLQPGEDLNLSCNMTSGRWTRETFPRCIESTCDAAEPLHGFSYCDDVGDARICSLECDANYRRSGPHMFMCRKKTGEWSPSLPELNKFPACINGKERCVNMAYPANGLMACNVSDGEQRCYPHCPAGFRFSSPIPDEGYYSCVNGKWSPSGTSPDCEESADEMNKVGDGHFSGVYTNIKSPADFSGMCYTWGQHHYKTFDGTIFRFRGNCQYLLARDFPGDQFQVHVKNDPDCDGSKVSCTREVIIVYGGEELTLKRDEGEPAAFIGDNKLTLPENIYGLSVERTADYIIVKDHASDLMVKWDGSEQIWVKVNDEMYGKVAGLCGTFNGCRDDDFSVINGDELKAIDSLNAFTQSYITSSVCETRGVEPYCQWGPDATFTERLLTGKGVERCSYLMDTECKDFVDPSPYFEACKEDSCFYGGDPNGVCSSMAAYFRECTKRGIHINWRQPGRCEISCPFGMEYDNCGTSCPKTCTGLDYNCEDHHCIDGCHCPADMYLQDGVCLEKSDCPCMFGNKAYAPKSKIRRDCNQCVCSRGKWICTRNVCDGVCRTYGDRHYQTFDGASYNMRVDSDCSYILARSAELESIPFEISVENKKCTRDFNGFKKPQVCTRNLIVKVDGHTMELKSGGSVTYGGKEVSLPFVKDNIAVEDVTSKYQKVTIWNGMTILWDKKLQIFIRARSNMCGKMAGLCGNFNSNQDDDFWAPDGVTHEDVYEFASLWQRRVCVDAPKIDPMLEHPCDTFAVNKRRAKEECGRLKDYEFLACHDVVDYQPFYESCLYDYCNMPMNYVSCEVFSTYALECAKHGVVLDWRSTNSCPEETCPSNEVWSECARSCDASCGALANEIPCNEECVPGCTCPEGQVRNYEGTCISAYDCPCYFDEVKFMPGESRMLDCNVCECYKGKWQCTENYCPVNDTCGENEEFVMCKWDKQITCFGMHLPYEEPVKPEHCMSGCQCVEGYVLDEVSGTCVLPESCPCVYGGKSYREGEEMRKDCNTCQCNAGVWNCTEEQCSSQCRIYGPSHVTTYDGLNYMISQDCVYTLSESTEDNPHQFEITVENIPCGTSGIACGKSITLRLYPGTAEEDTLILAKGKPVTVTKGSAFSTRYAGLYVFIDTPIGMTIQWDKGTHAIIKLQPEHSGQVRGLCGDFDSNSGNDLTHKNNAPTYDRAEIIASWQTETCDVGQDLSNTDMCAANPHRRAWAEARCAVIKNTFKECHSHVPPDAYYQRCVYDACGCDSGGDCDCFCTAVSAYANECNRKGVHVYWRTRDMCPMQCDGYRVYDPCESACPITCENYHMASKVKAECQDSCVEGCACKADLIYDQNEKCCVDSMNCICTVIAGVAYGEGDKIWSMSDECKSCYCMAHKVECLGLPCPTRMEPPEMPCTIPYWKTPVEKERKKYNPFRLKPSEETCSLEIDLAIEKCPAEMRDMCGYRCNQLCHSWSGATYQCIHGKEDECCLTCGETIKSCPAGQRLRNDTTCVPIDDCTCILPNGNILAPGDSWDCRTTCTKYTCWHNTLKTSIIHSCKQELELLPVEVGHEVAIVDTSSYECYTAQAINYEDTEEVLPHDDEIEKSRKTLSIETPITIDKQQDSAYNMPHTYVGIPEKVCDDLRILETSTSDDAIDHEFINRLPFTDDANFIGYPCGIFDQRYPSCYGGNYYATPSSISHSSDVSAETTPCGYAIPSIACLDQPIGGDFSSLSVCGNAIVCTGSDDDNESDGQKSTTVHKYYGTPCHGDQVFRDICQPSVLVDTPCHGGYFRGLPCQGTPSSTVITNYVTRGDSESASDKLSAVMDISASSLSCDSDINNIEISIPDVVQKPCAPSTDVDSSLSVICDETPLQTSSSTCPGVFEMPSDVSCSNGMVYDGYKCVNPEDCPCIYNEVRHRSGSVWKEDDGCVNCICISGVANCVTQTCDVTSCEPGYALVEVDGECCPTCLKTNVTCSDETHEVGEVWEDGCNVCTCTESGVVECHHVDCPATSQPECPAGHDLVQKVGECCPTFECVCNTDLCDNTEPTCPANHKVVASLSDGCCPEYQCVCDPETCPAVYCAADEKKSLVGSDGCCSTYRCERAGCLDTTGGWRNVGEIFTCPFNPCTTCTCNANGGLSCSANTCVETEISVCPSGSEPVKQLSEDGCCTSYVCDCQCSGIDMNWNTFDNKVITSTDIGVSRLVEDSVTGEFEVFVTRAVRDELTCVESLEIVDNIGCNTLKVACIPKIFINEEEVDIAPGNSIRKSGFRLGVDTANKISVEVLASGLTLSLSQGGREWSVVVPTTYRGRTAGLCGLCDGMIENDLWDGHQVLSTPAEFLQHFAIDCVSTQISIADCSKGDVCEEWVNMFSSYVGDKTKYINACKQDVCSGGSGCDVLAGLAAASRAAGVCVDWRTETFCPYSCPANMEYRACGSSVVRTCDNYKDVATSEKLTSEGCFCADDKVLINGQCSAPIECPVYTEKSGRTHCIGDVFISEDDNCMSSTVLSDGSLVKSAIECEEPTECAEGETQVVVGESNCCPAYECLPVDQCKGVVCPAYDDVTCDVGEEVQTIVHDECCVEMTCVCNEDKCPEYPVPHCENGETLVTKTSKCCTTQVCECNTDECDVPVCSGDGYHLEVIKSGRCCPVYECVCDRSLCPATEMPVCELGEVRTTVRTSDCCVSYECTCDESKCPTAKEDCPEGYVLTKRTVENACCPEVYECQCDESACPVEADVYCDSTAGYKRITTTSPRFAYTLPSCCPMQYEQLCVCDNSLCPAYEEPICGTYESVEYKSTSACCTQPQCVCDTSKCQATDTWCPSNKHATITLVDGCCEEVACECNECVAPEECKEGWIVSEYTDDCGCLKRHCEAPEYCVYNGDSHEPGETWTEDLCVECTCSSDVDETGQYTTECRNIKCGTCSSGFTYVPVAGACCGDCVPVTCHYDGQEYAVGQSWSQDGGACSTCTCEMNAETGEVYSTCVNTTCPPIDPLCAQEDIVTSEDGCCTYCKPTPKSLEPTTCSPMTETHFDLEFDGCTTSKNVTLATCSGSCVSMSTFSVEEGKFVKSCSCCTAVDTKDVEVTFNCPDGSVFTKTYQSAETCECHASNCSEP